MRTTQPNQGQLRAFSLIELLVVVTIITILGALSVPGIKRAMASSKKAECMSNMRQIGSALFAYAADNNGFIPAPSSVWPPSGDETIWSYNIWTYAGCGKYVYKTYDIGIRTGAKGKNIFRCPGNMSGFIKGPTVSQSVNGNKLSYGLNSGPVGEWIWKVPVPLALVTSSSRTVMVTEDSYCQGGKPGYFEYYGLIPHSDGSNFLFYDGHVEYMTSTEAYKTRNDTTFWGMVYAPQ